MFASIQPPWVCGFKPNMAHEAVADDVSVVLLPTPPPAMPNLTGSGPFCLQHRPVRERICHCIWCGSFMMLKTISCDHAVFSDGKQIYLYLRCEAES